MTVNKLTLLRYLYYNDNGDYLILNDILKDTQYVPDSIAHYEKIQDIISDLLSDGYISIPDKSYTPGIPYEKYDFSDLGKTYEIKRRTLGNTTVKAKIELTGREAYQKAYVAQDEVEERKKLTNTIIWANRAIILTFGAIVGGIIMQYYTIKISKEENEKFRNQLERFHTEEKTKIQQEIRIHPHDSLKITKHEK